MSQTNWIDESASIDPSVEMGHFNVIEAGAKIAAGVKIGNHCVIASDVEIGPDTELKSYVELRPGTRVGSGCYLDSGVKSSGKNRIGNNVVLRYDSIIARGCDIADGTYICPQVMTNNVDHNGNEVGGAKVGEGCFIGTQTVLGAGIEIAPKVVVGSCAMVTRSLDEVGIYIGAPAKLHVKA